MSQGAASSLLIDLDDDIVGEMEETVQIAPRDIEKEAHIIGNPLGVPDVGHGGSQIDVAHPLPPNSGTSYFHPAFVAYHAPIAYLLILSAITLPILGGAEDGLTEKPILLRTQAAIVNGLWLGHLAIGPRKDLLRRG
jgi:hypothetical protein